MSPRCSLICVAKMGSEGLGSTLDSYVPSPHTLRAALRVARSLTASRQFVDRFRATLSHLPTDGLYSLQNLLDGEAVLVRAGVATRDENWIMLHEAVPHDIGLLATLLLDRHPPPWLGAATRGGALDEGMVPQEDAGHLEAAIGDRDQRDALLLALGRKYDDASLRRLGEAGELVVVGACREALTQAGAPDLAEQVLQVSLVSDALGYDVRTPTTDGAHLRLEVKTDASRGPDARFFLSRNEWETARRDPAWRLVVCSRTEGGDVQVRGWLVPSALAPILPVDAGSSRWQSVELRTSGGSLRPGLPPVAP